MWRLVRPLLIFGTLFSPGLGVARSAAAGPSAARPVALPGLSAVAARVVAATVVLDVEQGAPVSDGLDALQRAYGRAAPPGEAVDASTGSGVLVRPSGLVLTNHHVVRGATTIHAVLADGRRLSAHVLGSDARTDVALVQLDSPGPYPWAPLGDSDALTVGTWVLTVGHPFSFPFTVTAGIVSARHRRGLAEGEIEDYLQTDAAVNPGGSGGPLFDLEGAVVGLNTAVYSSSQAGAPPAAGIAFAIPAKLAWRVAEALLAGQPVARPWIGLRTAETNADAEVRGALVTAVSGPAARAGLAVSDRVVQVDDEPVTDGAALRALIACKAPGDVLTLRVVAGGERRNLSLTVGDARDQLGAAAPPEAVRSWAGLSLGAATEDGAPVLGVAPDSPAARAGLRRGDQLRAVLGQTVDAREAWVDAAKGRTAALVQIQRDGEPLVAVLAGLTPP